MHEQAMEWVASHRTDAAVAVLDIGGRNINGSPRWLFPNATVYTVLDITDGEGVDIVADASTWVPDREYDVVVCCEVFEHTILWPAICGTARRALRPGGRFIITMAAPGRAPHSAVDGGERLYDGEHYGNVSAEALERVLYGQGWRGVVIDSQSSPADTRAVATK